MRLCDTLKTTGGVLSFEIKARLLQSAIGNHLRSCHHIVNKRIQKPNVSVVIVSVSEARGGRNERSYRLGCVRTRHYTALFGSTSYYAAFLLVVLGRMRHLDSSPVTRRPEHLKRRSDWPQVYTDVG